VTILSGFDTICRAVGITYYLGGVLRLAPRQLIRTISPEVHLHPAYNSQTLENDIAVLRLPVEANLCDSIRPIRLPGISSSSTNYEYLPAIASGWGRLNDGKNWYTLVLMSHKLKSRILLVFSNDNNNNNLEIGKLL